MRKVRKLWNACPRKWYQHAQMSHDKYITLTVTQITFSKLVSKLLMTNDKMILYVLVHKSSADYVPFHHYLH